jgi:hypothetical protein
MTIAPSNGVQPSLRSGLTCSFFVTKVAQKVAKRMTIAMTTKGAAVPIPRMRRVDIAASIDMVTRSPKQEAIGGAMLSTGRT